MQKLLSQTFTAYFVAYFVFAWARPMKSSSFNTNKEACKALLLLFFFCFFPRAQRVKDGQSPNQNFKKFSSFEFLNICILELN